MTCKHVVLMILMCNKAFGIPVRYVEEFTEFRRRVGRHKGMEQKDKHVMKD